jgi:hypothetical protein
VEWFLWVLRGRGWKGSGGILMLLVRVGEGVYAECLGKHLPELMIYLSRDLVVEMELGALLFWREDCIDI